MIYAKLKNTKKGNILIVNPLTLIQYNCKNNNILLITRNHQNNILLKSYVNLNHIEKEKMRKYRNHPEVRKYLYQTHFISKLEHKNFIKKLKHNTKKSYFCVILDGQIIGNINFHIKENEIDFGFYANPFSKILGIGRILEQISIYYAFKIINTPVLSLEIFSDNTQVINLHHKFDFKVIQESVYKNRKILKMSLNNPYHKTFLN
ncbi:UDP-4-amino-4,6-dideoxy-N-acetyl-beta-L-altrosamine N-acetyltransferase [Campylobacter coli]|nr:UDP-4-amino-4,6-dideoxy-N-acetyl-beta-L-altrosamine N-acetyltransferase [Campylobacter coli]